jgi:hypothetical protein
MNNYKLKNILAVGETVAVFPKTRTALWTGNQLSPTIISQTRKTQLSQTFFAI